MKSFGGKRIAMAILCVNIAIAHIPLTANIYYNESMVSAQVADMFRYGDVNTALFTGKINFSIPIYSLNDPDFNLDISLSYNSEAFKPRKHSGFIGYNWFLNAGGSITREVRNIPDEVTRYDIPSATTEIGMLSFLDSAILDKEKVFNFDSDLFSLCTNKDEYRLGNKCDLIIDYQPDIFHFNFCGYQGVFMIDNEGSPIVISGDFVDVDLSQTTYNIPTTKSIDPQPNDSSHITIKTNDGYTYIFGGELAALEYSLATQNGTCELKQQSPTISTWHLTKIIAPNQRKITFHYKLISDNLWTFNEYYNYFAPKNNDEVIDATTNLGYNKTKECILDAITISGSQEVKVRFYSHVDSYKLYNHHKYYSLAKPNFMLDSIMVSTNENVLKMARLTSCYKSYIYSDTSFSYNWRFLSSVSIDGTGKYLFTYNHSSNYPELLTLEEKNNKKTTFDGYWIENPLQGLLTEVTLPTGCVQKFTYQKHRYGTEHRYVMLGGKDVSMISITPTGEPQIPGARIEKVETFEGEQPIETKTYTYLQPNSNLSSGIYWNKIFIYPESYQYPRDTPYLIRYKNNYSFLESNIGYTHIVEKCTLHKTNEIHKKEYTFYVGNNNYNSQLDPFIHRKDSAVTADDIYYVLSGALTYDSQLVPTGKLLSTKYYKNNQLIQSKQFEYNGISSSSSELIPTSPSFGCIDTIVIFSPTLLPVARKLFVYPPIVEQEITNDYNTDGHPLCNSKRYTYDNQYRIKEIATINSDNIEHFTRYTYNDDILTVNSSNNSNAYTLLKKAHIRNKPIETISGYKQMGQEYITSGTINLFSTGMYAKVSSSNLSDFNHPHRSRPDFLDSLIIKDTITQFIPDSTATGEIVYYPYLSQTLELQTQHGITNYQPLTFDDNNIYYDHRYRKICDYKFDPLLRLTEITHSNKVTTLYTWDGIFPTSQTTGGYTNTYTHIPYVGISSTTDARGVTTYYEYDAYGRLIEIYQLNNGRKEILNKYIYHIKSEPQL